MNKLHKRFLEESKKTLLDKFLCLDLRKIISGAIQGIQEIQGRIRGYQEVKKGFQWRFWRFQAHTKGSRSVLCFFQVTQEVLDAFQSD